ncbi:SRPBCC family protein [Nocardia sp. NPDC051052]|uniref:SRPBCC family protein n=1 Tax=Nocardia sp. NPDC051052 TaxID=3364322 RepID=UPI0037B080CD
MTDNLTRVALFRIQVDIHIFASPVEVYETVSDLPRSREWSAECIGGQWISGAPRAVGSVFRGDNVRGIGAVAWAPVVRGQWTTEAQIVAAEPSRRFAWAMRDSAGNVQDSRWSFDLESTDYGCLLVHRFHMGTATEGIHRITADMDRSTFEKFIEEWSEKVAADMKATLVRIKRIVEDSRR